jgi:hypothetical protein
MAKRSGSKSSRSERKAGRERAERARDRGLPEKRSEPLRARAATPEPVSSVDGEDRSSDAPPAPTKPPGGVPTLVKVVGAALVLLMGAYVLSLLRDDGLTDTKPAAEPAGKSSAVAETQLAPEPAANRGAATPAPEVTPTAESAPALASPVPDSLPAVTPPNEPAVAAPVVASPRVPQASKPTVAPPRAVVAPAPISRPAAPVAAPVAPAPAPAAPKPVDNPY